MRPHLQTELAISSQTVGMVIRSADASYMDLRSTLADLDEDALIDLIALAWMGRGDFGVAELKTARAAANRRHRHCPSDYLLSTPRLGTLLEDGASALAP